MLVGEMPTSTVEAVNRTGAETDEPIAQEHRPELSAANAVDSDGDEPEAHAEPPQQYQRDGGEKVSEVVDALEGSHPASPEQEDIGNMVLYERVLEGAPWAELLSVSYSLVEETIHREAVEATRLPDAHIHLSGLHTEGDKLFVRLVLSLGETMTAEEVQGILDGCPFAETVALEARRKNIQMPEGNGNGVAAEHNKYNADVNGKDLVTKGRKLLKKKVKKPAKGAASLVVDEPSEHAAGAPQSRRRTNYKEAPTPYYKAISGAAIRAARNSRSASKPRRTRAAEDISENFAPIHIPRTPTVPPSSRGAVNRSVSASLALNLGDKISTGRALRTPRAGRVPSAHTPRAGGNNAAPRSTVQHRCFGSVVASRNPSVPAGARASTAAGRGETKQVTSRVGRRRNRRSVPPQHVVFVEMSYRRRTELRATSVAAEGDAAGCDDQVEVECEEVPRADAPEPEAREVEVPEPEARLPEACEEDLLEMKTPVPEEPKQGTDTDSAAAQSPSDAKGQEGDDAVKPGDVPPSEEPNDPEPDMEAQAEEGGDAPVAAAAAAASGDVTSPSARASVHRSESAEEKGEAATSESGPNA